MARIEDYGLIGDLQRRGLEVSDQPVVLDPC